MIMKKILFIQLYKINKHSFARITPPKKRFMSPYYKKALLWTKYAKNLIALILLPINFYSLVLNWGDFNYDLVTSTTNNSFYIGVLTFMLTYRPCFFILKLMVKRENKTIEAECRRLKDEWGDNVDIKKLRKEKKFIHINNIPEYYYREKKLHIVFIFFWNTFAINFVFNLSFIFLEYFLINVFYCIDLILKFFF